MKQKKSVAARVLNECGVNLWQIEEESQRIAARTAAGAQASAQRQQSGRFPDLVAEGHAGTLGLVIGRERELEHLIQILSRKTKNSAILVGEPGAGKDSIVRALAQRIANSAVPAGLANRQILVVDRADLVEAFALSQVGGPILYVRGLFEARDAVPGLTHYLKRGQLQVMTTGTTVSFRLALEKADEAARNFEVVSVLPPTDDEAFAILTEVKEQFERFHGVIVFPDAVRTAVSASGRFLRHRVLPDRALDLIDDACALLKLRRFGNRLELKAADVVEAIAFRTSLTPDAVRAALERPETPDRADRMRRELAAGIPAGRQDWVDGLSAYLADCSDEEAQRLIEGIRSAKRKFDQPI